MVLRLYYKINEVTNKYFALFKYCCVFLLYAFKMLEFVNVFFPQLIILTLFLHEVQSKEQSERTRIIMFLNLLTLALWKHLPFVTFTSQKLFSVFIIENILTRESRQAKLGNNIGQRMRRKIMDNGKPSLLQNAIKYQKVVTSQLQFCFVFLLFLHGMLYTNKPVPASHSLSVI